MLCHHKEMVLAVSESPKMIRSTRPAVSACLNVMYSRFPGQEEEIKLAGVNLKNSSSTPFIPNQTWVGTCGNVGFWVRDMKSVANTYFWIVEGVQKYPRSKEIPYILGFYPPTTTNRSFCDSFSVSHVKTMHSHRSPSIWG